MTSASPCPVRPVRPPVVATLDAETGVFTAALNLDLERDAFRATFSGLLSDLLSTEGGGDEAKADEGVFCEAASHHALSNEQGPFQV